jgi:hypothetical protein
MNGSKSVLSRICAQGGVFVWLTLLQLILLWPTVQTISPSAQLHPIAGKSLLFPVPRQPSLAALAALDLRGGGAVEDESEDDEDGVDPYYEDDSFSMLNLCRRAVSFVGRVMKAVFEGDDIAEEKGSDTSIVSSIKRMISRMWKAAVSSEELDSESDEDADGDDVDDVSESRSSDFGTFLSKSYDVEATREDDTSPILGGSINDALNIARSQSRLLVVFIPSSRPGRGKKNADDKKAIESFLSAEVATMAEKRARRKEEGGSFLLWGATAGSPEAVVAMKRLKAQQANNKGQKQPVLIVAYPAQAVDGRGQPQIVPKLLAQHHCSPPPSSETMATWLNALRKRHAKQYASMQLQSREAQYFKDRNEGYKESLKSDKEREEREAREEAERIAKEKAEKERQETIKKRREELRDLLTDEPGNDAADTKTISLRLADGRFGKRRFAADAELADVFNWLDVTFEIERESVQLTTMNGKSSFSWEGGDSTLAEAGLGRMAGLRVIEKKETECSKET